MKSVIFLAALAAAAPLNKRDIVYSTTTQEVLETVWTTTTFYVNPTPSAAGGFFEIHSSPAAASSIPSSVPAVSPSQAPSPSSTPVQIPTSVAAPTSQAPAVQIPTTQAPVQTPTPTPTPTPQAQAASSSSGSLTYTGGDGTFYDVSVGTGSCGIQGSNSQMLVAVASDVMNNGANPNSNPWCGKTINIEYNGVTAQATIYDTCPTCSGNSLDMTQTLFQKFADPGVGRIHGVSWGFA